MTKVEKVNIAIQKTEKELERLRSLKNKVEGNATKVCPHCKTENMHWYTEDVWICLLKSKLWEIYIY
jgi:ribosomal protein L37AE/L43A